MVIQSWLPKGWVMTEKGCEEAFGSTKNILYFGLCVGYIKIYPSVYLRFMSFTVYTL